MRKNIKFAAKITAFLLSITLLVSAFIVPVSATDVISSVSLDSLNTQSETSLPTYNAVFASQDGANTEITDYKDQDGNVYDNTVYWESKNGSVTYSVNIEKSGLYNIAFLYALSSDEGSDWSFSLNIDGKLPFEDAENLVLPRYWQDNGDKRSDNFGNEIAPEQATFNKVITKRLYDFSGELDSPYLLEFSSGLHTITVSASSQSVYIIGIKVLPPEDIPAYSEYIKACKAAGYEDYSGEKLTVEAENAYCKSSRSLIAKSDRSSAKLSPSSATRDVLNTIGGTSWQQTSSEIVWKVDVPKKGLYKLGFSYLQNTVINGISYRHLKINGVTPFDKAECIKFQYDTSWKYVGFEDENNEPYLFALDEGVQEISLTVTLGENFKVYNDLKNITAKLGDLYIDITIITGESPDVNRDYELFKKVPDWENRLKDLKNGLAELSKLIKEQTGKRGSTMIAAADNTARTVGNMLDNPYTAQIYVSDYYSCYTTLSSWLYDVKQMPLALDKIEFYSPNAELSSKNVNIFDSLLFGFKRFLVSFSNDYASLSSAEEKDGKTLKIWVNWGRDQAMVLNNLIEESFSEYAKKELGYNVSVNLELVNTSLVKGILSNNAPDLALHQVRSEPVNLAIRGALCDLSKFDGFDEVVTRFNPTATLPYQYNGGTYALPDQQTFFLMFYRKDILEQLGISVPDTWDEFLAATAVLQRNNMNSYIPYTKIANETTVNTGIGSLNLFASILLQHKGSLYNKELNKCLLDSSASVGAFKYWIEMYTQYKLPTEADFYNRLRLGTSPLGISQYTLYNTLSQAAPEIDGRWGIALIPGIKDVKTGEINRDISGGGTGCSILSVSKNKEAAWAFLKWWTLADTQLAYNNNVEAVIGSTARVPLATVEAFNKLSWKYKDLETLKEQFSLVKEINEVPGSYYVSRAVDQAYWNVVTNGENVKDVLIEWGSVANEEIERKINEYKNKN